ncbi:MAG: hypothetical protein ACREJ2_11755 [Planctomycetota bacterium]
MDPRLKRIRSRGEGTPPTGAAETTQPAPAGPPLPPSSANIPGAPAPTDGDADLRDLGRLAGMGLFGLSALGAVGFPVLALISWLFQLYYFAALFSILFLVALAGFFTLEFIRLRGWRYSLRQLLLAGLVLFVIGTLCAWLGRAEYRLSWAHEVPLTLEHWPELSLSQRNQLAHAIVDGKVVPTLAQLLQLREHADYKPVSVTWHGRPVQAFAFAIGPWKLLGTECLVVRVDVERQEPTYSIEPVRSAEWDSP